MDDEIAVGEAMSNRDNWLSGNAAFFLQERDRDGFIARLEAEQSKAPSDWDRQVHMRYGLFNLQRCRTAPRHPQVRLSCPPRVHAR